MYGLALAVGALVVVVDQLSKSWVLRVLADRAPIHLVGSLRLNLSFNTGVAFSVGRGRGSLAVPLALLTLVILVIVGRSARTRMAGVALGLVVGGAVGNLADRLFRHHGGGVIDFVDLQWWPVFNLADASICVGAALLVVVSLRTSAR